MMPGELSPYLMRRVHGWGPKGRTCADCYFLSIPEDEPDFNDMDFECCGYCSHAQSPAFYAVLGEFKACGLFRSQWQHERELLEAQGQQSIFMLLASCLSLQGAC